MIDPELLSGLQNYVGASPMPMASPMGGLSPDQLAGLQQYVGGGPTGMPTSGIPSPVPEFSAGVINAMPGAMDDPSSPGRMSPAMSSASMPPIDAGGGGGVAPGAIGQVPGVVGDAVAGQAMPLDGSVPVAPVPAAPKPAGSGMGADPMAGQRADAADQVRTAVEQQGKAGTDAAIAQSAFAQEQQKQLEQMAVQQAQAEQQRKVAETKAFDEYTAVKNEAMKPDAQADPGKWWKDQTTFGKAMSALSLIIGTIGEATARAGGGNVQIGGMANGVMQAIQKNVAEQKEAIKASREQKNQNFAMAGNAYGMARQRGLDDRQAEAAATTMHLNQLKAMSDSVGAKSNIEKVKTDAAATSALLEQKIVETETKARHDWQQDYLARKQGVLAERQTNLAEARFGLDVQQERNKVALAGAPDKEQRKLITEVEERSRNIKTRIQNLRDMIGEKGTGELLGSHEAKLKGALNDIATDSAKLMDPGSVARPAEVQQAMESLFTPGAWQQDSTALDILNSYEQSIERRRMEAYRVRGLAAPADSSASATAQRLGATRR